MRLAISPLLFFPSITFGLLTAEIFPWALLISLVFLKEINKYFLWIIMILALSSIFSLYQYSVNNIPIDLMRSLAAYANIILISQYIISLNQKQTLQLILLAKYIFFFLLFMGALQFIGIGLIDDLIRFLVPRGSGYALIDSGRGVSLLSSEPARAGIELTLIYAIYRLTLLKSNTFHYFDILILIFQIIVIKSSSSVFFTMIFVSLLYVNWRGLLLIPIFAFIFFYILISFEGSRASDLFLSIIDLGFDDISVLILFLVNESGNRLLGLYSFFLYGFQNPFGGGVGLWQTTSMDAVISTGFDISQIRFFEVNADGNLSSFRGPGVISNLMLDFGIIGTLAISWLFYKTIQIYMQLKVQKKIMRILLVIFLVKIFIFGSPGNPIPFIMLFLVYKFIYHKKHIVN